MKRLYFPFVLVALALSVGGCANNRQHAMYNGGGMPMAAGVVITATGILLAQQHPMYRPYYQPAPRMQMPMQMQPQMPMRPIQTQMQPQPQIHMQSGPVQSMQRFPLRGMQ